MSTYELRDEGGDTELAASSMSEAVAMAEGILQDIEWGNDKTIYVSAYVIEIDDDGDDIDEAQIEVCIEPPEPDCTEADHDWQAPVEVVGGLEENPGVFGEGGGVRIYRVCRHCGVRCCTNTWDQRAADDGQPRETVRYDPADARSEMWVAVQRALNAESLDDLAYELERIDIDAASRLRLDWYAVPEFGGEAPESVSYWDDDRGAVKVWSWDEARLLIVDDEGGVIVVDREDKR